MDRYGQVAETGDVYRPSVCDLNAEVILQLDYIIIDGVIYEDFT